MSSYKSSEKIINADVSTVYKRLSNPQGFKGLADNVPENLKQQVGNLRIEDDTIHLKANTIGDISFKIAKRVENERICLESVSFPFPFTIEIQMSAASGTTTRALVVFKIELNPIIKPMISKYLQEGVEKFAELLTVIPYNSPLFDQQ